MAKKRPNSMNPELLEFLKFLHLHNLVDIIPIIESIPLYYETQIKKFKVDFDEDYVFLQQCKIQNYVYIAYNLFHFQFRDVNVDFCTWRIGPHSLNLENEIRNIIFSQIFNNAISSQKTIERRYDIKDYDKDLLIQLFDRVENYRSFLFFINNKPLNFLKDISTTLWYHNHHSNKENNSNLHDEYSSSYSNKMKILRKALKGIATWKYGQKEYDEYISKLITMCFSYLGINHYYTVEYIPNFNYRNSSCSASTITTTTKTTLHSS